MRKLVLKILSTLALLHPLSLAAQNSFSLSLDGNGAAGDQAVTSINVSADQVVAIQIFGKDIQNANGLAVRFEYDANQMTYEGFDVGAVLPNAQALPEHGSTFVEIGIASLGGQATANSGLVGTVRFRTTTAFSSTAIRLVRAELSRGGRFETVILNMRVALQSVPIPSNFSLSLDVNGGVGNQAVTSVNVLADEDVAIQIFGQDIQNAKRISARFEYNANQIVYEGFDVGDVLPNVQVLSEHGSNFIKISLVSFGNYARVNTGLLGTIRFRTTAEFSGTAIRLVRAELGRGGQIDRITLVVRVELQAVTPDFNGDGMVGFADFLVFGNQFGARQGDGKYEAKYDLDGDGKIGFSDFLIFGNNFGKKISSPGGSGNDEETTVSIPDANLRAVITESLNKPHDAPITSAEMASLTRLEAKNAGISDLTGLEYATNLTQLDFGEEWVSGDGYRNSNNISNIAPLSGLINLTQLDLSNNDISDIKPLADLTKLTSMDLGDNFVSDSDIALLSSLINLTHLDLSNNDISDIKPLSGLTNLTSLSLSSNDISDIKPLADLTKLTSMDLGDNFVSDSDIALLSSLINLTRLDLINNDISDIKPLSGLTNLTSLSLSSNNISDIKPLSGLTNLTSLSLSSNDISDIKPLSGLTNLRSLYLFNNNISDIKPLADLINLTSLNLGSNDISDIKPLSRSNKPEISVSF